MFPVSAKEPKRRMGLRAKLSCGLQPGQSKPRRTTCVEDVLPPCHSPTLSRSGWNYYHASVNLSMIGLMQLALYVEDLASGMGTLSPHIVENTNVICNRLLPHLEGMTGVPRCPGCLHPQGGCSCQKTPLQMSYSQLQTAPPAFTTLAGGTASMVQSTASRGTTVSSGTPHLALLSTVPGVTHSMEWAPRDSPPSLPLPRL